MSEDVIALLLRANLALAAAIALVLVARAPVRRWFGARVAYALWLIPPLTAAVCFVPAPVVTLYVATEFLPPPPPAAAESAVPVSELGATTLAPALVLAAWSVGVFLFAALLGLRQARFVKALGRLTPRADLGKRVFSAESAHAGPAVIGVLRPLIVAPADFDTRYNADERRIVLAHERAHIAQGDPLINAAAALMQCISWFNPLMHIAAKALRADQELACDAAVLARTRGRRAYAEALLKTHAAPMVAPLGCAWPPETIDAFKERLTMLKRNAPTRTQIALGASVIAIASATACALAWAAQPTRVVTVYEDFEATRERVERDMAQARRDIETAHRQIETNAQYMREHREDMNLTSEEIDRITTEAMENAQRGAEEAQAQMQQALIESQRAAQEQARTRTEAATNAQRAEWAEHARVLAAEAERLSHQGQEVAGERARIEAERAALAARLSRSEAQAHALARVDSAVLIELEERGRAMATHAARISAADVSGVELGEAERDAIEEAMATNAMRISELAMQVEAQANVNTNIDVQVDLDGGDER